MTRKREVGKPWRVDFKDAFGQMIFEGDAPVLSGNSGVSFHPDEDTLHHVCTLHNAWLREQKKLEGKA